LILALRESFLIRGVSFDAPLLFGRGIVIENVISLENYKIAQTALSEYKDLLSVEDLSKIFDVSKTTVYKSIKSGKFGLPIQIGRSYKIPKIYVLKKYFCSCG
jgi:predicted DNA-binding transcriptional regulator AlpA